MAAILYYILIYEFNISEAAMHGQKQAYIKRNLLMLCILERPKYKGDYDWSQILQKLIAGLKAGRKQTN